MKDRGMLGGLHPFLKLLFLVLVMLASTMVVFILGILAAIPFFGSDIIHGFGTDQADINLLRYVQILSHLGLFVGASLVFAYFVGSDPLRYFQGKQWPAGHTLLVSAFIMLAAVPLVYYLSHVNQSLSLPESLKSIEDWMRQTEDAAEDMTKLLLEVSTLRGLMFNVFMIAIIPAVGEEFIFRGALQRIFHQWTGRVHVAVIISAILFSAMHMQFYGFLPRLLLGIMLGYMFVMSRNIWVPVFAHFFNNAAAVILYYMAHNKLIDFELESIGTGRLSVWLALLSLVVTVFLFRLLFAETRRGL